MLISELISSTNKVVPDMSTPTPTLVASSLSEDDFDRLKAQERDTTGSESDETRHFHSSKSATRTAWAAETEAPSSTGLYVERAVPYSGESASWLSFFLMFPNIIFRHRGSVFPEILFEMGVATLMGFIAFG